MTIQTEQETLWRRIQQAGGIEGFITAQLQERGFLVVRQDTAGMSGRELDEYKKALKKEAEERRKLRRETWGVYKANHIVFLGEGIYWQDTATQDKWDTPNSEERAAENELPALDTPQQLAESLGLTIGQLRGMAFHREAATSLNYRRFTIPKRGGGERPIWAPLPRLMAAQRWILRNIVEKLLVHGASHGFLAGRSILSNAAVHTNPKVIVKMDIKDFFPTVTFRRVRGIFRRAGYREQISTLLALLCTESPREIVDVEGKQYFVSLGPRCLPQGAPTSPALTNTLCLRMDRRIAGLVAKLGWRYTRYADDLTFSISDEHEGDPKIGTILGCVAKIVTDEGFQIHPDKTRVSRKGGCQRVTGLVVNGGTAPRVPRKLKRQLRAAIHNAGLGKTQDGGWTREQIIGYAAYVAMTNPIKGRKLLAEARSLPKES